MTVQRNVVSAPCGSSEERRRLRRAQRGKAAEARARGKQPRSPRAQRYRSILPRSHVQLRQLRGARPRGIGGRSEQAAERLFKYAKAAHKSQKQRHIAVF